MTNRRTIPHVKALEFMTAGKATVTFQSKKTNKHFTYRIVASPNNTNIAFVKLLTGSDNTSSFTYIGFMKRGSMGWYYIHGTKSRISTDAQSVKAFIYVLSNINLKDHANDVDIWHEGKCCKCGRKLTHPNSIETGIGPECAKSKIFKSYK